MRYDINTAYDYNRMESAAPKRQPREKTKVRAIPVKRHKSRASTGASALIAKLAAVAVLVGLICCNLCILAEINDTQTQIDAAQKKIEELKSEQTHLEMEMENIVSYANLEQQAQKLGMQKMSKAQVHYINTSGSDSAQIVKNNK